MLMNHDVLEQASQIPFALSCIREVWSLDFRGERRTLAPVFTRLRVG